MRQEGVIITAQAQNEDDTNSLKIDKQCILNKIPTTSSPQQVSIATIARSRIADKQKSAASNRKQDAEEQAGQKPKRKRHKRK